MGEMTLMRRFNRLICRLFGHAEPDSRVTALHYLLTFERVHQCPRCHEIIKQKEQA